MLNRRRHICIFIGLVFVFSWLIDLSIWFFRFHPLAISLSLALVMLVPGTMALFCQKVLLNKPLEQLGFRRGQWATYVIAYFLPLVYMTGSYMLSNLLGLAHLDLQLSTLLAQMPAGSAFDPNKLALLIALGSLTFTVFFNCFFTLGEELGWRGFLYKELKRTEYPWPKFATNIVWGIWHTPLIILGLNYPGRPVSGSLMMIIFTLLMGWILCLLMDRSKSIFPPVLAHAVLNAQGRGILTQIFPVKDPLIGGPTGFIGLLLLLIIGLLLNWHYERDITAGKDEFCDRREL